MGPPRRPRRTRPAPRGRILELDVEFLDFLGLGFRCRRPFQYGPDGWYEHLAKDELDWKGGRVNPRAIRRTALFTIAGERDDISAIGQTVAVHDLCSSLRHYRKKHHMQAGVGHYGVFSGCR